MCENVFTIIFMRIEMFAFFNEKLAFSLCGYFGGEILIILQIGKIKEVILNLPILIIST